MILHGELTVEMNTKIGHWWKIECWQTAAGTPWCRLWQAVVWILSISPVLCQHSSSVCCSSSRIRSPPCSWRTFGQPSLRPRLQCWHVPACHRHKSAPSYLGPWWCPATLPCRAGTVVGQARNLVGRRKSTSGCQTADHGMPLSGVATGGRGGARAPSTPPGTTHEIRANPKTFLVGE